MYICASFGKQLHDRCTRLRKKLLLSDCTTCMLTQSACSSQVHAHPECVPACAAVQCILCRRHLILNNSVGCCSHKILQRCQRASPSWLALQADINLCVLGFCLSMLLSPYDFDMQPPDPGLLIGNPVSASNQSPAPQPNSPVVAAAKASAFSKTALGVILGIGIPLTVGVGMFVYTLYPPLATACVACMCCLPTAIRMVSSHVSS